MVTCPFWEIRAISIAAAVLLRDGRVLTWTRWRTSARRSWRGFKVRRHVRIVEQFPMTASGKIQRFRLREEHGAG